MIVIDYTPSKFRFNNVILEAVFIPEDFKPTCLPQAGSNWEPFSRPTGSYEFTRYAIMKKSKPSSRNFPNSLLQILLKQNSNL